ncbi:MAG: YqgE/AlgH family protein [Nitrospira sp.]|nr:MAG: YqgE/AlgH family protein [Nitrospira sp.]
MRIHDSHSHPLLYTSPLTFSCDCHLCQRVVAFCGWIYISPLSLLKRPSAMYQRAMCSYIKRIMLSFLFLGDMIVLSSVPGSAQQEFSFTSVEKGVLLVASPSLSDPNFHQSVLLIVEHGRGGTVGLILNRPTNVLVSEALPDFTVLKQTIHRLFAGGPVERTQLVLLFRLTQLLPDTRQIVDGIYVGTPRVLERIMTQPKPSEAFRAFSGFAGWAPGQLEHEMRDGTWGVLPKNSFDIFDEDSTTLWPDCITRLQVSRSISY